MGFPLRHFQPCSPLDPTGWTAGFLGKGNPIGMVSAASHRRLAADMGKNGWWPRQAKTTHQHIAAHLLVGEDPIIEQMMMAVAIQDNRKMDASCFLPAETKKVSDMY